MNEFFRAILVRADLPDGSLFAAHEGARWPDGALDWLTGAGILTAAEPAKEILCEECPEGCWIKPTIGKDPKTHRRVGTYFCRRNDDIGWFKVDLSRKQRWAFSLSGLAKVVSKAVKPTGKVTELAPERLAMLGTVKLDGKVRELFLARGAAWPDAAQVFGNCSRLKMASHPAVLTLAAMPKEPLLTGCDLAVRPLVEIADFDGKVLHIPLQGAFPEVAPSPRAEVAGISPPAARNGKPSAVDETAMLPAPNMIDAQAVAQANSKEQPVAPDHNVALLTFMQKFCEPLLLDLQRKYAKQLKNAHNNGKIELPAHVGNPKKGQRHVYKAAALLRAWPRLRGYMPELPPLKVP